MDEAELLRWRVVNDGVRGGRSSAQNEVANSIMAMTVDIATDAVDGPFEFDLGWTDACL